MRAGRVAKMVVVALAVGLLSTSASALAPYPASAQDDPAPGLIPAGDWTQDQVDYMLDLIERAEAALPAFADENGMLDVDLMESLGFVNFGATAGGWDHWINQEWIDDDHIIDPEHPESLVFRSTEEGWVLEAAMFFLRSEDRTEDIPTRYADIAWLPGWHAHANLCWDENLQISGCGDGVGEPILIPMMHVWITDNPCHHRFAGVDVGGIVCDDHHEPGPGQICELEEGWLTEADPEQVGAADIDLEELCEEPPGGGNGDDHGHDGGHDNDSLEPPPAPAIGGKPGFTG